MARILIAVAIAVAVGLALTLSVAGRQPSSRAPAAAAEARPLTASGARDLVAKGAILVDVREPGELAETGRLRGAINVPLTKLKAAAGGEIPAGLAAAKDRPVILYCRSGRRSAEAGRILAARGYSRLYNLGGFEDAVKAGLPAE